MIRVTAEARWFFRGGPPREVREWFLRGDLWTEQAARVDTYLLLPGCTTAGIKLREGRFEVKARTAAPVATDYSHGVRAHRDGWVKWSCAVPEAPGARAALQADRERWVSVGKRRFLRGFTLEGAAAYRPREVAATSIRPRRGCGVEMTEVTMGGGPTWWTLGLEGFDDDGTPDEALDRVARAFFSVAPPMSLKLDASCSYVAWLVRRFADADAAES